MKKIKSNNKPSKLREIPLNILKKSLFSNNNKSLWNLSKNPFKNKANNKEALKKSVHKEDKALQIK